MKSKRNTKITATGQNEENYARLQSSIEHKTGFTEARRHDTPMLFSKFRQEILEVMSNGKRKDDNIGGVKAVMPEVSGAFQKYMQLLKQGKVPIEELVFTKRIPKNSN